MLEGNQSRGWQFGHLIWVIFFWSYDLKKHGKSKIIWDVTDCGGFSAFLSVKW